MAATAQGVFESLKRCSENAFEYLPSTSTTKSGTIGAQRLGGWRLPSLSPAAGRRKRPTGPRSRRAPCLAVKGKNRSSSSSDQTCADESHATTESLSATYVQPRYQVPSSSSSSDQTCADESHATTESLSATYVQPRYQVPSSSSSSDQTCALESHVTTGSLSATYVQPRYQVPSGGRRLPSLSPAAGRRKRPTGPRSRRAPCLAVKGKNRSSSSSDQTCADESHATTESATYVQPRYQVPSSSSDQPYADESPATTESATYV
ncbi:streptococcal hemagglutinin-like [Littorina saxatilis]|uniref:streptococcal hemagglutinin-like n=1 Tax=Littorina saxatilis TaxID=31220 RepID=UPI0038B47891